MAKIVAGFGVPHTPVFPSVVQRNGPDCEESVLYREVAQHLEAVAPDALLLISNDHFNTFFFDNFPLFAIGVAEQTSGPNDGTPMPAYTAPVHEALAETIRSGLIPRYFDIAVTQEFSLDHSFMVPYHFLNAAQKLPIIPLFVHGFSNPLPNADRAYALGEAIAEILEAHPGAERVAIMASGSFSLEIGGPLAAPGERSGTPDREWAAHVKMRMENAEIDDLVEEATGERMARAGNAGGELLNWLVMLGAIGAREPISFKPQVDHGHAFGIWRWD
ncbi:MAG: extradiol ring-cleavage dioxygenase [Beijerinckiaceae bacterium]